MSDNSKIQTTHLQRWAYVYVRQSTATQVAVNFSLEHGVLALQVADDGVGRDPASWSHGLGLGGVRKRVKLLDGEVRWRENAPRGIVCAVRVANFVGPP